VHLVGFIIKKFVTIHGHMNVKFVNAKQAKETYQNKFVKLVHLVGFIIKKFVTIHSHMNVKKKTPQRSMTSVTA
jgi:predicted RNA-binding protein YlqC (UPF0109 family)